MTPREQDEAIRAMQRAITAIEAAMPHIGQNFDRKEYPSVEEYRSNLDLLMTEAHDKIQQQWEKQEWNAKKTR